MRPVRRPHARADGRHRPGGRRRAPAAARAPRDGRRRSAIVPVTGDRGLAGAFNAQVLRRVVRADARGAGRRAGGPLLHRRARRRSRRSASGGCTLAAVVDRLHRQAGLLRRPGDRARASPRRTSNGEVDRVVARLQRVRLAARPDGDRERAAADPGRRARGRGGRATSASASASTSSSSPSRARSSSGCCPVYVETELYRALLESAASEQGARMTAMRNASKAAGELIDTPHAGDEPRPPGRDHPGDPRGRGRRGRADAVAAAQRSRDFRARSNVLYLRTLCSQRAARCGATDR